MIVKTTGPYKLLLLFPKDIHTLFKEQDKAYIMNFFGYSSEAEFEKLQRMHKEGMTTYRYSLALGVVQNEQGMTIGHTGYHIWNKDHRNAELFYSLKSDEYKRKGIMSSVVPLVLQVGFEHMKLHRVQARVAAWNTASIRLLEKLGFQKEGIHQQDYFYEGQFSDSICYSLLTEE
ncbi:ribosomal-protein-alanine N-acetyltransferase [Lishizhenia tianjinensis]|uniref:Ribosomal-protein-alanine N-acetyltransferase n=1 Tax=Lishizhenia tianjinensis TaxID=477690 RepID=A0A1I6X933_9FLAO|nr:GNAT family protein [Lishizhenia tianjinensis]SFT34656.1 ribosomal-protein-alanine N-acetyltransferase [Lishizhenia tianjinensis]